MDKIKIDGNIVQKTIKINTQEGQSITIICDDGILKKIEIASIP